MKKQQITVQIREREMVEGKRWEKEGESKAAGDRDKEDKAASNAANKDKSKLKTAHASGTTEASETIGASETMGISEITRASEITSTPEVLATTPSESSEFEDNNLEAEHGSGTENVSQHSNEEDEDKDGSNDIEVDDNNDNEGGEGEEVCVDGGDNSFVEIEEEDGEMKEEKGDEDNVAVVEAMDIGSRVLRDKMKWKWQKFS
ncbi:hypothetical protein BDQ17DRAFT_1325989 [Cyathus striatus]|nr:hypothetical protein BDQ17DRAFT_1325989 [Cyathus striatus]